MAAKPTVTAIEAGLKGLGEEVEKVKQRVDRNEDRNSNIIISVVIALAFIIVTVAVEVILFHTRSNTEIKDFQKEYYENIAKKESLIKEQEKKMEELQREVDELRKLSPSQKSNKRGG